MQPNVREPLTVDCRGLQCPAPILRLSEVVRKRKGQGGMLTVLATDVDFPVDLDAWCRTTKSKVVHLDREPDGVIRAEVRLADPSAPDSMPYRTTVVNPRGIHGDAIPDPRDSAEVTIPSRTAQTSVTPPGDETLDLTGMSIGAAMKTLNAAASATPGLLAKVRSDALGFEKRFVAWAMAMEATIESIDRTGGRVTALVRFPSDSADPTPLSAALRVEPTSAVAARASLQRAPLDPPRAVESASEKAPSEPPRSAVSSPSPRENKTTLLVLRNDLESLLAALMVANASAAQGVAVEVYFAFWGIHLLRGRSSRVARGNDRPGLLQRMMLWLVPKGTKQRLGKLHMGGLGTRILLRLMRKRNILALDKLVESAAAQGVRFRVCSMSMGLMGLQESDIVDLPNIDFAGVTSFAEASTRSAASFVF